MEASLHVQGNGPAEDKWPPSLERYRALLSAGRVAVHVEAHVSLSHLWRKSLRWCQGGAGGALPSQRPSAGGLRAGADPVLGRQSTSKSQAAERIQSPVRVHHDIYD